MRIMQFEANMMLDQTRNHSAGKIQQKLMPVMAAGGVTRRFELHQGSSVAKPAD
jgi:hypothetical protein